MTGAHFGGGPGADGGDDAVLDDDVPARVTRALGVDGHDIGTLDDEGSRGGSGHHGLLRLRDPSRVRVQSTAVPAANPPARPTNAAGLG